MKRFLSLVVASYLAAFLPLSAECIKGNCYSGLGTYVYPSGAKYVGAFRKGKIHGDGILFFSNGNKYTGQWIDHYRQGKGKMEFSDGSVYVGGFHKSKIHGQGTMSFPDGDRYVGQWVSDKQHGEGIYYYADGDRYEGQFKRGKLNGQGTMFYKDGDKYTGGWKDNYKDGQGTYYKVSGSTISGLWLAGKFAGEEQPAVAEADVPLEKDLRNCNRQDCGNGVGVFTYADGSKWVGEFRNGKPEGRGTCYYANGDKYVGDWKRHAPHGDGRMQYANGRVVGAHWDYGRPSGELDAGDAVVNAGDIKVDKDKDVKIWAVVVGVARYAHMPVLKYTDDDAYQIYAFLKSPQGGALPDQQIKVLIDENATRKNILKTMQQTFLQADENDVVVLYFSGHGLPGSFLPVDFDGFNNKVNHEDIQAIFKKTKAKHKLCLADACHSGSLMAMRSGHSRISDFYSAFENTTGGTALLLSSKGDEFSLEDQGLRQGIYSHFLIRGLKGEADRNQNKIVTIRELFDFVYQKVRAYTANAQTPTLSGKFDEKMPVALVREW